MKPSLPLKRVGPLLAAPILAIALGACGGDAETVTTASADDATTAPGAPESAPAEQVPTEPAPAATPAASTSEQATDSEPSTDQRAELEDASETAADSTAATETPTEPPAAPTEEPAPPAEPARAPIEQLSADVAIANAQVNTELLVPADGAETVFDIEVLAVADGSVQTLRDVVVGDRPVLLWFFSPH